MDRNTRLRDFARAIAFCLTYENVTERETVLAWNGNLDLSDAADAVRPLLAVALWALGEDRFNPSEEDLKREIALVNGRATHIKGYVFESARLPEIRGASGLLDRVNQVDLRSLWETHVCAEAVIYANGGEILAFAPPSQAAALADAIEREFTRETLVAQSVAVAHTFTLRQLREGVLPSLTSTQRAIARQLVGYDPAAPDTATNSGSPEEQHGFGTLPMALGLERYRRREGDEDKSRHPAICAIPYFETIPFARRCSSCDRRAVVAELQVSGAAPNLPEGAADTVETLPLCEPCARKRLYGQYTKKDQKEAIPAWWTKAGFPWRPRPAPAWIVRFQEFLKEKDNSKLLVDYYDGRDEDKVRVPKTLNEIGDASTPKGFIGVVYADGNNMGRLLEQLQTPVDYAEFAEAVYQATQRAAYTALAKHLKVHELDPDAVQAHSGQERHIHPFEILSIGGDDLFLIVPAHLALRIACTIGRTAETYLIAEYPRRFKRPPLAAPRAVHRCLVEETSSEPQCSVSLSAGVVIADAGTPIYYLRNLAEDLLKSAKTGAKRLQRQYGYQGGTVDFLAIKSFPTISGTIRDFRAEALTSRQGPPRRLYARPYTFVEIETLLQNIEALKAVGFPRSQLSRLQASLDVSTMRSIVDYYYFLSRTDKVLKKRKEVEKQWPNRDVPFPWRNIYDPEEPVKLETIWYDLIELYDFVPGEEVADAADTD